VIEFTGDGRLVVKIGLLGPVAWRTPPRHYGPWGKGQSVEVDFGSTVVHIGNEFPAMGIVSPRTLGGTARALGAGAEVRHPLADQFWGERHGQLTDPFGHRWNVAQRIRTVPHEEIVAAAAKAFGG
jgi:PhnB protein